MPMTKQEIQNRIDVLIIDRAIERSVGNLERVKECDEDINKLKKMMTNGD